MNYRGALNIEDLRQMARKCLPRVAYDYLEGGAEDDVTLCENRAVFERIRLCPRTLADVSGRSQQVEVFGKTFNMPFGVAPTGAAGLYCFEADIALARAAAAAGVPFVLSTASFTAMERVAQAAGGTKWFQLYMSKDREAAQRLVTRAHAAGYEALVVTTDVPVGANREYNRRNGFEIPFRLNPANMINGALHPRWLINVFLRTLMDSGVPRFLNVDHDAGGRIVSKNLSEFRARRDALDWSDLRWLREVWPGKLMVKGVLTVEDALLAAENGADGIFVSNHGGRQLDGAVSPIEVLPEIVAAAGDRLAIMVDSGFRRGTDIVKALALGADMVFVGRAPLYGAAVGAEAGVRHALDILKSEIDRVMALIGCCSIGDLGPQYLELPDALRV
ncbi:MAG TPA: alpha-hydroxy acid oxidase [Burkholderiales bacterium]|nr:alpha-hydroxy acid oxidase [Burkholderiales bacterium]